jgi:hypothetical protein
VQVKMTGCQFRSRFNPTLPEMVREIPVEVKMDAVSGEFAHRMGMKTDRPARNNGVNLSILLR